MTDVASLLADLVRIDSVSPGLPQGSQGEQQIADFVRQFCEHLGLDAECQDVTPGRPNVVALLDSGNAAGALLLEAHMDTATTIGWQDALVPQSTSSRLYGRGSCDAKGALAGMLCSLELLVKSRRRLKANVILSATVDEEDRMIGLPKLLEHPAIGRAAAAIVGEPTGLACAVSTTGVVRFRIHTAGRAAHSSRPELGVNAIYGMAPVVSALESYGEELSRSGAHRLCGSPKITVGRVYGGSQANIVPDECTIEIDRRLVPGETLEVVLTDVDAVLLEVRRSRPELIFHRDDPFFACPPLDDQTASPIARAAQLASKECRLPPRVVGVPFGSHAGLLADRGIPSIVMGPGSIDQAHANPEWVSLAELRISPSLYATSALKYCDLLSSVT